jgi:two-component system chemotaxis response regulator CheB
MDGLELLDKLQKEGIRARVIMVSTMTTEDADVTILAMERGAIDFVTKPGNVIEAKGDDFKTRLLTELRAVLISGKTATKPKADAAIQSKKSLSKSKGNNNNTGNKLIALACSTGGPKALQSVIPLLPKNLDAPMVLVQHMPPGFTKSMAERLNDLSHVSVKEAQDGDRLEKGHVYIAPGGLHMEVVHAADGSHKIVLNDKIPEIGGLKPCANITYDSLVNTAYDEIVCVVLTGMGSDGTKGILSLGRSKPIHVIAQDAQSCVVYGMPKAIVETGLVDEIVPLDEVAKTITKNVGVR